MTAFKNFAVKNSLAVINVLSLTLKNLIVKLKIYIFNLSPQKTVQQRYLYIVNYKQNKNSISLVLSN